jgi:hypothetical protein
MYTLAAPDTDREGVPIADGQRASLVKIEHSWKIFGTATPIERIRNLIERLTSIEYHALCFVQICRNYPVLTFASSRQLPYSRTQLVT